MAFSSIFVLPILVLFLLLQKRIVAGLTAGALK
jgi:multiple sugar transport system permease protein